MSVAAQVLDEPRYATAAAKAADAILKGMRTPDGKLLRTARDGNAKLNAYLEDYSYFANGLISLYEATFDPRWLTAAGKILDRMVDQFWDESEGGFFFTGKDHEKLLTRTKDPSDGATPSGNSMAATALVRFGHLTGRSDVVEKAERTFRLFRATMAENPFGAAQMLLALRMHLGPTTEVAIVGNPADDETKRVLRTLHGRYMPNKVVALRSLEASRQTDVPLLEGKTAMGAGPTVYLCRKFACSAPTEGAEAFSKAWTAVDS
jgi:uncharacterized protein YyaL (SSP411 family)